jgi:spore maturation protein SpmB
MALVKKVNVYESFIEGAKDGFNIAVKIIPYLVAILVSIAVFRASGAFEILIEGIRFIMGLFTDKTEFVDALPTALMKPLSGSGARGMMLDAFETHGVDSFAGKLSATLQGATDTTFYIVAVYFGSVGIKKTRYAIKAGLIADLAGIIAAIVIAYLFFGDDIQKNQLTTAEIATEIENSINQKNMEALYGYLDSDCVIYDQAYDTIGKTSHQVIENFFGKTPMVIKKSQILSENDQTVIFLKGLTETNEKKTVKLIMDKQKVQSIQYLGNF